MTSLKGITVKLYERAEDDADELGNPTYTETSATVDNVLVAPVSASELTGQSPTELEGKLLTMRLAVPKGDTHSWLNNRVEFFGRNWVITGDVKMGIEELIPMQWHHIYQAVCVDGESSTD